MQGRPRTHYFRSNGTCPAQAQPTRFGTLEWRGRMAIDAVHLWWRAADRRGPSHYFICTRNGQGRHAPKLVLYMESEGFMKASMRGTYLYSTSLSKSPFSLRRIDSEGWSGVDDPYLKRVHVEAKVGKWVPPNRFGEIINEPEKSGDEHENPLF